MKKILVIGIVSMFLLISTTILSEAEVYKITSEKSIDYKTAVDTTQVYGYVIDKTGTGLDQVRVNIAQNFAQSPETPHYQNETYTNSMGYYVFYDVPVYRYYGICVYKEGYDYTWWQYNHLEFFLSSGPFKFDIKLQKEKSRSKCFSDTQLPFFEDIILKFPFLTKLVQFTIFN